MQKKIYKVLFNMKKIWYGNQRIISEFEINPRLIARFNK